MARWNTIILNPGTFSQQALFADGSQSAPSIAFTSDSDTGIFWSSSGDVRVSLNGSGTFAFRATNFIPTSDGSVSLGLSGTRWGDVQTKQITIGQSLANPTMGVVTLSGSGVAIVYTSAFTSGARVFLTHQNAAGTTGTARVTASTAGVGFTITSSSATDTSTIGWWVVPVS